MTPPGMMHYPPSPTVSVLCGSIVSLFHFLSQMYIILFHFIPVPHYSFTYTALALLHPQFAPIKCD